MTYTVITTMPDGNKPDLPPMDRDQLINYLTALQAKGWDPENLPDTGQATAAYFTPGDTTIEWSPVTD